MENAATYTPNHNRTKYYGKPRALIGQELTDGLCVTRRSDETLQTMRMMIIGRRERELTAALTNDLAVIELELDRRAAIG
jgi:hypothetical protein